MRATKAAVAAGALLCLAAACGPALHDAASQPPEERSEGERAGEEPSYLARRMEMIEEIEADVRATRRYLGKDRLDPRVMAAVARVPREEFVPDDLRHRAYENRPLPIGEGQTISQPYIVALMSDLLELSADDVVLEVGTGSGYQAAILAELTRRVYTIEIIPSLGRSAAALLSRLGYRNVTSRIGDGYRGWEEHAPFDGIIVTAAAPEIPPPLLEQLRPGGRMVIPVVSGLTGEQLTVVRKTADGEIHRREVLPVRFVPLTGDH